MASQDARDHAFILAVSLYFLYDGIEISPQDERGMNMTETIVVLISPAVERLPRRSRTTGTSTMIGGLPFASVAAMPGLAMMMSSWKMASKEIPFLYLKH